MVTFDDVLPTLVQTLEARPDFASIHTCVVVRDLHGRVRIVIKPQDGPASTEGPGFNKAAAEKALESLDGYFVAPIWSTAGKSADERRLAGGLLERASPWEPEFLDPVTGDPRTPRGSWRKYERRLSKNAWLDQGATNLPWPLEDGPCITTFYSFKGGIGRTTALASCAWQLAEEGKKVVILDLDLEAPGIGTLLEVESPRGLLDLLVDCIATGKLDLEGAYAPTRALDVNDRVMVLPAGRLDEKFVEKLARLDFSSQGAHDSTPSQASPMEQALRSILKSVRDQLDPDHIFLDARSGLHDISGLSLHRLAHTDVLLARAGEQSYQGLDLTLRSLIRRKGHKDLRCVVVHSMAEPGDTSAAQEEKDEFRQRAYNSFNGALYSKFSGPPPSIGSVAAPHNPFPIPFNQELVRFGSIKNLRRHLLYNEYIELHERVTALAAGNNGSTDDEA